MNNGTTRKPRVIVLRTAGTNCDRETAFAFQSCGAQVDLVHINSLLAKKKRLEDYQVLAIPGGFTYGDDIMSGKILANELRLRLGDAVARFIDDGKLIIGICNGFQVLVRAGILPGQLDARAEGPGGKKGFSQSVTLTYNDSGKFEDRWIHLRVEGRSVWTEGLPDIVFFPVAHAEGKFIAQDESALKKINANGQVAFRYCAPDGQPPLYPGNPNGSVEHIAGITDRTGRVLGLMPHPERHFFSVQHPCWTREKKSSDLGSGARIFENGVTYVKDHLLK